MRRTGPRFGLRVEGERTPAILSISEIDTRENWNGRLRDLPGAHVLQTWEWGDFKRETGGWTPQRLAFERGGQLVAMASILVRRLGPLKVMYVSKGPSLDYADQDLSEQVLE